MTRPLPPLPEPRVVSQSTGTMYLFTIPVEMPLSRDEMAFYQERMREWMRARSGRKGNPA